MLSDVLRETIRLLLYEMVVVKSVLHKNLSVVHISFSER